MIQQVTTHTLTFPYSPQSPAGLRLQLLTPVAAIQWSRGIYLLVVTAFAVVFTIAMATFEARIAYLFVGVTAYYAVLVAFLANLPG